MSLLRIAHRGNTTRHTENTFEALVSAIAEGADGVEFDVQLTADGQLVLFHDDTLERLAFDSRSIYECTWEELSQIRLPGGEQIPTLEGVLPLCQQTVFYLEVKIPEDKKRDASYLDTICAKILERLPPVAHFSTVGSFHPGVLERLAPNCPWPLTAICEKANPCPPEIFRKATYFSLEFGMPIDFPARTFLWGVDPIEHLECLDRSLWGLVSDHWFSSKNPSAP